MQNTSHKSSLTLHCKQCVDRLISLSDIDQLWLANYENWSNNFVPCVFSLGEQLQNSLPRKGNYTVDYVCCLCPSWKCCLSFSEYEKKKKKIPFFAFVAEPLGVSCFVHKQVRIVGGGPVPIKEGSWMVSIQKGWVTQCSLLFNYLSTCKRSQ